jgi:hypothetical protein
MAMRYSKIKNDENRITGMIQLLESEKLIAFSIALQAKKELMIVKNIKLYFNICFCMLLFYQIIGKRKRIRRDPV